TRDKRAKVDPVDVVPVVVAYCKCIWCHVIICPSLILK
uniref:CSON010225 protein n=1 Tax=Culicoides sonorensis TaxID=179676 RepID=A0A336N9N0_CULSO